MGKVDRLKRSVLRCKILSVTDLAVTASRINTFQ